MRYVLIPNTQLRVSQICIGSAEFGASISVPASAALLDEFVTLGGNFIDTAHIYSDWIPNTHGTSEKTIGAWLRASGMRDQMVMGTKGGHPALSTMHISRLSNAEIEHDLIESLDYLDTDYIDIYWLHRDDPAIPVAELVDILNEQVATGKIRYFGLSNWTSARIQSAWEYAASKGLDNVVANQLFWSLAYPTVENFPDKTIVAMDHTSLEFHRRTGMTVLAYSSQAHGFFTKIDRSGRSDISRGDLALFDNQTNMIRLERIRDLARRYQVPINDIVLAYLISQPFPTIPIVGCRRVEQVQSSVKSVGLALTTAELAYLENV